MDRRTFVHRINARDRISFANEDWYAFARENGGDSLTPANLIGRHLFDFLCHEETKHLFDVLIQQVRRTGRTMVFPFRCDSPDYRRFMELTVNRHQQGEVEFCSRILWKERRVPMKLLASDVVRSDERLIMCGWCKRVALPEGRWAEVEVAVSEMGLFAKPKLPRIVQGICPRCSTTVSHWP